MELEGTVEELMFTIHAHPTLAESLLDAYGPSRAWRSTREELQRGEQHLAKAF